MVSITTVIISVLLWGLAGFFFGRLTKSCDCGPNIIKVVEKMKREEVINIVKECIREFVDGTHSDGYCGVGRGSFYRHGEEVIGNVRSWIRSYLSFHIDSSGKIINSSDDLDNIKEPSKILKIGDLFQLLLTQFDITITPRQPENIEMKLKK